MNPEKSYDEDESPVVEGFEVPRSPDSSYNNMYPAYDDEAGVPPMLPPHLNHSLLNGENQNTDNLPLPQQSTLNHLYIENRNGPRHFVALGVTNRFLSKFVTVVLYKPVH